ncbi:hypothetical protein, partial [Pseudomonas sp.]|uniref:hypothetical protein n=1 Tax=Pseudomonas sp. TaxID=306 RepID=UPI003FD6C3EA
GGSNPPGSTKSTKKDVHGRLFLCLKFSEYGSFKAFGGFPYFLSFRRFGIPIGIPPTHSSHLRKPSRKTVKAR